MTIRSLSKRSLFALSLLSAISLMLSGCDLLVQLQDMNQGGSDQMGEPIAGDVDNDDTGPGDDDGPCNDDDDDDDDEGDDDDTPSNVPPWTPPPAPADCEEGETLWDTVTLRTQEDAEAFGAVYTVARSIVIEGQELTNLDALRCLEQVNGLTAIDTALERVELPSAIRVMVVNFEENAQLREISLPMAEEVDGITLISNPQLTRVSAPAANSTIFRTWLEDNAELTEVDFRSVTQSRSVVARENPSLRRFVMPNLVETGTLDFRDSGLEGTLDFSSLEVLNSHLAITGNDSLQEVRLDSLVETDQELIVSGNASLETIRLDSLESVSWYMSFAENSSLRELHLPELNYLYGFMTISNNESLTSLRIPQLEVVGDPDTAQYLRSSLRVVDNPQLSEIAFDSLMAVGQQFRIERNDRITDLDGFSSLRVVRGNFSVHGNRMLRDMTGLNGMESVGMGGVDRGDFRVGDNPRMPIEQAETLAYDIIGEDNIGGVIDIRDVPFGGGF